METIILSLVINQDAVPPPQHPFAKTISDDRKLHTTFSHNQHNLDENAPSHRSIQLESIGI